MRHQPSRAFRHKTPEQENRKSEHATDPEAQPPADVNRKKVLIEKHGGDGCASRCAGPKTAVHDQVDSAAIFCRDQFVDRRVDGGILAPDTHSGQHAESRKTQEIPGERAKEHAGEIDDQRCIKHQPTPETVGHPARDKRAGHRTHDIARGNRA
jgi:hypothetical protein